MGKQVKKEVAKKVVKKEYIPIDDPRALETVEVIKPFGPYGLKDKIEGHPNTLNILKDKGLVK